MTITGVGTAKKTAATTGVHTIASVVATTIGNCLILGACPDGTNTITSISYAGVTTWTKVVSGTTTGTGISGAVMELWIGPITATNVGATLTITWSGSITGASTFAIVQEVTAGFAATWALDGSQAGTHANSSGTTVTFPTLVPAGSDELYFGYSFVAQNANTTITSGFTAQLDAYDDVFIYGDISASSTPVGHLTTAGVSWTLAALIVATPISTDITFRAANSATASGTTDVVVTKPSGTVAGDYLLGFMSLGSSGGGGASMIGPSGWTFLGVGGVDGNTGNLAVWELVAGASEPSTYTFGKGGITGNATAAILGFSNPDAAPVDAGPVFNDSTTTGTSQVATGVTSTRTNDILVCAFASNSGGGTAGSYTPPSGMTERTDAAQGTTNFMCTDTLQLTTPAATGNKTATSNVTSKWTSVSIAIAGRSGAQTIAMGVATNINLTAYAMSILKTIVMGLASVTNTAYAMTLSKGGLIVLGKATQITNTAYAMTLSKLRTLGLATQVVNTAYAMTRLKTYLLGASTQVVNTAYAMTRLKTYLLGHPTVTNTAYPMTRTKTYPMGEAAQVVNTAYAMTVGQANSIHIGEATQVVNTAHPIGFVQTHRPWILTKWFTTRANVLNKYSEQQGV